MNMKLQTTFSANENSGRSILTEQSMSAQFQYRRLLSKSESSVDSESNWLITLSDVFTLLLVFLIMFFVMTKTSKGSVKPHPVNAQNAFLPLESPDNNPPVIARGVENEIVSRINRLHLGSDVSVVATRGGITISMKEKVTFLPGEADILTGFEPVLDNIAEIIQKYPGFIVEIEGHTDNVPIRTSRFPSNWELSIARATSVLKYFIDYHSIDPSRLSVKGNADQKPLAQNNTPENRAKNRRVEIRLKETEA
jgi:chemotaxis protein MotB